MSDEYARNVAKFRIENHDKIEAAFKVATDTAMNYCLHNVCGDDGEAFPLVDMLTLEGQPITKGKEEIELLLDSVLFDALLAYEGISDD